MELDPCVWNERFSGGQTAKTVSAEHVRVGGSVQPMDWLVRWQSTGWGP